ncbi:MAG: hypothetical protein Q4D79_05310 [Propionibacteriaceae bacterium]|nr:hypothetical protein [Propionibacteriaceae bacterium]
MTLKAVRLLREARTVACFSLSDRLKPWEVVAARLRHLSRADMAVASYRPRSVARPAQLEAAKAVLLAERPAETVVVLARYWPGEESCTVPILGTATQPKLT